MTCYFGKYRATVVDNKDPDKIGRVRVTLDNPLFDEPQWAMPSVPFTGPQAGVYVVPPEKARVWIEFEEGDRCKPIWCGGFWDKKTVPSEALDPAPPVPHILLTTGKNSVHLCDGAAKPLTSAGGIVLKSGSSTVVIRPDGITITADKIDIKGLTTINDGALTVQK